MIKRLLQVLFIGALTLHFGQILIYNIAQVTKTHWDLYNSEDPGYEDVNQATLGVMRSLSVFSNYQDLSGTNTAYAFYAPQVCGHLEPFFQVYQGEEKIQEHYNIALKTAEAGLRLEAVFGGNLERLEEILRLKDETEARKKIDYKLLDIKMHSLATRVLNQVGTGDRIEAGLYFYNTSSLYQYCSGQDRLRPAYNKTITYEYQTNAK